MIRLKDGSEWPDESIPTWVLCIGIAWSRTKTGIAGFLPDGERMRLDAAAVEGMPILPIVDDQRFILALAPEWAEVLQSYGPFYIDGWNEIYRLSPKTGRSSIRSIFASYLDIQIARAKAY